MSMTNAQAALIAAAGTGYRDAESVLEAANEYFQWLDAQDAFEHPADPWRQCESISPGSSRCNKAAGHEGKHINDKHGTAWSDGSTAESAGTVVHTTPARHFFPLGAESNFTPCGISRDNTLSTTEFTGDVTCTACREALGLH